MVVERFVRSIGVFAITMHLFLAHVVVAGESPTILALGDSITAGGKSFRVYREFLVPALQKKGLKVEFIGPNRDKTSAHAGYGGKNTAYLRKALSKIYGKHAADIVLIHSGHNSFAKDKPVDGIVRDTEDVINAVHAMNPKATILLAQVITAGKLPKYSYIPELNKELAILAGNLKKQGKKVILVDMATGFDWRQDTVADKVHPNASGAQKMADKWLEALLPILRN